MSFHSSLTASAVWPADLVSAGVVTSTAQVYVGRRPKKPGRTDLEVWLERRPDPPIEGAGFQFIDVHAYTVHVRARGNVGHDGTGNTNLAIVEAHLQTIVARYDGAIPFSSTFSGMLPCEAVEGQVDVDPEDEAWTEGQVDVVFRVRR